MALTKFNYNSFDVTPVASTTMAFNSGANGLTTMSAGAMTLIKTVTASSDSSITLVNGTDHVVLDSTYPIYKVEMINVHPSSEQKFYVNFSFTEGYLSNPCKLKSVVKDLYSEKEIRILTEINIETQE